MSRTAGAHAPDPKATRGCRGRRSVSDETAPPAEAGTEPRNGAGSRQPAESRPIADRRIVGHDEVLQVGDVCLDVDRHECIVRARRSSSR